jgi:hypothetical protein
MVGAHAVFGVYGAPLFCLLRLHEGGHGPPSSVPEDLNK